jgi:hypothetical protein
MEDKAESLRNEFNWALSSDNFNKVKTLLKENESLIEYMNVYSDRSVKEVWTKEVVTTTSEEYFKR